MNRLPFVLILLCQLGMCFPAAQVALAVPNPFTTAPRDEQVQAPESGMVSPLAPVLKRIIMIQNSLRQTMAQTAESIRNNPLGGAFWTFMLLAFAYGAAHALGPGHGKLLAASYFLHRESSVWQVLFYSYLSMVLHVLSAIVLVLGGKYLLQMSASRAVDDMGRLLQDVSYGMLFLVGLCLLVGALRGCRCKPAGGNVPESVDLNATPWKSLSALALASGLVPCPGASLVLIFSISLGILGTGLLAMVAISLGMGLCLATISLLIMHSRQGLLKCLERRSSLFHASRCLLSLLGSLLITATGGLLLLGSL